MSRIGALFAHWRWLVLWMLIWLATGLRPAAAQSALDGFNPGANNVVRVAVAQADGRLLVGGDFSEIAGQTRNRIARLNADGTLDAAFNPSPSDNYDARVWAIAVQPDGKILVGGQFTNIGGLPVARIARLNTDGTVDPTFNATPDHVVTQLIVQPDGKILAGGAFTNVGGQLHRKLVRLHADGTVDASFNAQVGGAFSPSAIALQADGKVLLGGQFTTVNDQPRSNVVRLHPDGSVDADFDPGANLSVSSIVVQPDGKIVLGGEFTWIAGRWHNRLARFNEDGTFDESFVPNPNNEVRTLALQPDGKILAGGAFGTMGGQPRNRLARLNADGTLDASFGNPGADNLPLSIAVQTDGHIVVGGYFSEVAGQTRNRIARLNADGTLDAAFNPGADQTVRAVAVQADGKVLAGGDFTSFGGQPRARVARASSADVALQALEVTPSGDGVRWLRSGAGPEVTQVRFATAAAPDAPAAGWTDLGGATRVAGGWTIDGLNLPRRTTLWVRAQGLAPAGGASGSLIGSVRELYLPDVPAAPTGLSAASGNGVVHLTWTAAQANGSAITAYTVVGAPLAGGANVGCTAAAALGCSVTGLANGTLYRFSVTATNSVGTSLPSAVVQAAAQADVPGVPSALDALAGDGAVALTWAAPVSNGGAPITGYTVTGTAAGGGAPVGCTTSGALACTVSGLTNGTAYTFTVAASNAAGMGASSSPRTATPQLWREPAVPLPGGGNAAVQVGAPPGCTITAAHIDNTAPPGAPAGASFPLGVFRFTAAGAGCSSAALSVRIDYPAGRLSGLRPYKYGPPTGGAAVAWFPHGTVSGDSVAFVVTDNGAGDSNPQPGAIEDPFAPLLLPQGPSGAAAIPTLTEWGLALLSLLAGLAGVCGLRRRGTA